VRSARLPFAILAFLALGCALVVARIAGSRAVGIELGGARTSSLEPALAERVARGDLDLLVQWFAPAGARRPHGYDDVEAAVASTFAALHAASPTHVRTQILRPDEDQEARRHAEALGIGPFRARRIERDGWSESEVWSALRVVVAGRGAGVVRALTPELAHDLQALIAAEIREIEAPRRPIVALSAPPGHARLRQLLQELADVRDVDFDASAEVPADADLLVWIAPKRGEDRHVARLRSFVERGGSLVLAGSRFTARVERDALVLEPTGIAHDAILAAFGLAADAGVLLESPPPDARGEAYAWQVVRSIGSRQDFRAFGPQPNGTLAFVAPTALSARAERLRELGLSYTSLATSSERCFTLSDSSSAVPLAELTRGRAGRAQPPRTLLALLSPRDPTQGCVVVAASASPFGDAGLSEEAYVHRELVRILVGGLASAERRALASVARTRPTPLEPSSRGERWTARAVGVALVPLLLLLVGLARGAFDVRALSVRGLPWALLVVAGVLVPGAIAVAIGTRAGAALTAGAGNRVAPELERLAREATADRAIEITAAFSAPSRLPPELRPLTEDLVARCASLARSNARLAFREIAPDALDASAADEFGARLLSGTSQRDEETASRSFFASLVVSSGAERQVLEFPDAGSFAHAEFRLALALFGLQRGRPATLAFASEPARTTPAEALELYQKRGLFAPGTGDPFASARALLERNGFRVVAIDPAHGDLPDGIDAFVWLQPRRDAARLTAILSRHLQSGGRALVAAQHHRLRVRVRSDSEPALWPEPLFPDLDRLWLPRIGVRLEPELVLDARHGEALVEGTVERDGRVESVRMGLANPLLVRSTPDDRPRAAFTAGVGDLLLTSPSRIAFEPGELATWGLLATPILATSLRAWTHAWTGGVLSSATFDVPAETSGPFVLGLAIEGTFPGPTLEPELPTLPAPDHRGVGQLVLLGTCEPFTDANLQLPGYDHARFLLQACAALALPEELAQLLARRPTTGGYRFLEPDQRLSARLFGLAAGPLLVLIGALAWRGVRSRRRTSRSAP